MCSLLRVLLDTLFKTSKITFAKRASEVHSFLLRWWRIRCTGLRPVREVTTTSSRHSERITPAVLPTMATKRLVLYASFFGLLRVSKVLPSRRWPAPGSSPTWHGLARRSRKPGDDLRVHSALNRQARPGDSSRRSARSRSLGAESQLGLPSHRAFLRHDALDVPRDTRI